jgi:hypothetical protein
MVAASEFMTVEVGDGVLGFRVLDEALKQRLGQCVPVADEDVLGAEHGPRVAERAGRAELDRLGDELHLALEVVSVLQPVGEDEAEMAGEEDDAPRAVPLEEMEEVVGEGAAGDGDEEFRGRARAAAEAGAQPTAEDRDVDVGESQVVSAFTAR